MSGQALRFLRPACLLVAPPTEIEIGANGGSCTRMGSRPTASRAAAYPDSATFAGNEPTPGAVARARIHRKIFPPDRVSGSPRGARPRRSGAAAGHSGLRPDGESPPASDDRARPERERGKRCFNHGGHGEPGDRKEIADAPRPPWIKRNDTWSGRQDSHLRPLASEASTLTRLSYVRENGASGAADAHFRGKSGWLISSPGHNRRPR